MLQHPGKARLEEAAAAISCWGSLPKDAEKSCRLCETCQFCEKASKRKYGKASAKEAEQARWSRARAGLWCPATVRNARGAARPSKLKELEMHAVAMAGPAAGWLEAALLEAEPSAGAMQKLLGERWAAKEAGSGGGGELKAELAELRGSMGIARKPSSSWNPQSNSVLERVHQVFGDMMRTCELDSQMLDENEPFQKFLAGTA